MWGWFRKGPRFYSHRFILEQLEERIVLDAAVPATTQDYPDQQADSAGPADVAASSGATTAEATSAQAAAPQTDPVAQVFHQDLNVVLISNALGNIPAIAAAAAEGAFVVVYDAQQGTLPTITAKLQIIVDSTGQKIDHLAIASHGEAGVLNLSDIQTIGPDRVIDEAADWQALGSLLAEGARIDLYGCDVGAGENGIRLVTAIAQTTAATVWASDDTTGGGPAADWDLEVRTSESAAGYLLDASALDGVVVSLNDSTITNPSFESNYSGWYMYQGVWSGVTGRDAPGSQPGSTLDATGLNNNVLSTYNTYYDFKDARNESFWWYGSSYTYHPTNGSKMATLIAGNQWGVIAAQKITLDSSAYAINWDMSYAHDVYNWSDQHYVRLSLRNGAAATPNDAGILQDLFYVHSGSTDQNTMTSYTVNISAQAGKTVWLDIRALGNKTTPICHAHVDVDDFDILHKPTLQSWSLSGLEDTVITTGTGSSVWKYNDLDGDVPDTLFIRNIPTHGTLFKDIDNDSRVDAGEAIAASTSIAWADRGKIKYLPSSEWFGTDSFTWNVKTTDQWAAADATVSITVTEVLDGPKAQNFTDDSLLENQTGTIDDWDFVYGLGGEPLQMKIVSGIPNFSTQGVLFLDGNHDGQWNFGEEITAGQLINWTDATTNELVKLTPKMNWYGTFTLQYQIKDSLDWGPSASGTITVQAVNAAPQVNAPSYAIIDEDTSLTLPRPGMWFDQIMVGDVDAAETGDGKIEVTLVATHGQITLGNDALADFTAPNGDSDGSDGTLSFRATGLNATNAMNGITYIPDPEYYGVATITVTADDLGKTGLPGPLTGMDVVPVFVKNTPEAGDSQEVIDAINEWNDQAVEEFKIAVAAGEFYTPPPFVPPPGMVLGQIPEDLGSLAVAGSSAFAGGLSLAPIPFHVWSEGGFGWPSGEGLTRPGGGANPLNTVPDAGAPIDFGPYPLSHPAALPGSIPGPFPWWFLFEPAAGLLGPDAASGSTGSHSGTSFPIDMPPTGIEIPLTPLMQMLQSLGQGLPQEPPSFLMGVPETTSFLDILQDHYAINPAQPEVDPCILAALGEGQPRVFDLEKITAMDIFLVV